MRKPKHVLVAESALRCSSACLNSFSSELKSAMIHMLWCTSGFMASAFDNLVLLTIKPTCTQHATIVKKH